MTPPAPPSRQPEPRPWRFLKAEGLGNDFLLHLEGEGEEPLGPAAVRAVCDRRRGVGADGVLLLGSAAGAEHYRMVLINADGSPAEISGNGLRCAVAALSRWWRRGDAAGLRIDTGAGPRWGRVIGEAAGPGEEALEVEVEMGSATAGGASVGGALLESCGARRLPDGALSVPVGEERVLGYPVSMGNPHFVIPCATLPSRAGAERMGPLLERLACFPEGSNVHWMRQGAGGGRLELQIWERGAGWTPACGSGACAASSVAWSLGWGAPTEGWGVEMPGGSVRVRQGAEGLLLAGPVRRVARGETWLPR